MQNRAARILTGRNYDVPTTDLMEQAKKWNCTRSNKNSFNIGDNQNYSSRTNLNNFKLDKPKRNFMEKKH